MIDSLYDLDLQIQEKGGKLYCFYGQDVDVLKNIAQVRKINSVWYNQDLTPFATKRDEQVYNWCKEMGIPCNSTEDYTFHSVDHVRNKQGGIYQVFTPFKNACKDLVVPKPRPFVSNDCFLQIVLETLTREIPLLLLHLNMIT